MVFQTVIRNHNVVLVGDQMYNKNVVLKEDQIYNNNVDLVEDQIYNDNAVLVEDRRENGSVPHARLCDNFIEISDNFIDNFLPIVRQHLHICTGESMRAFHR